MEFFRIQKDIPFMRHALKFNIISLVTFLLAVVVLFSKGLHLSVEFTGGTVMEVGYSQPPAPVAPSTVCQRQWCRPRPRVARRSHAPVLGTSDTILLPFLASLARAAAMLMSPFQPRERQSEPPARSLM